MRTTRSEPSGRRLQSGNGSREEADDLQVRIAVNTGVALVSLDSRPREREAIAAGDVVNTAQRLQVGASVDGILVGEQTYRATRDAIEYRAVAPVEARGESEPIPAWEAVEAHSPPGVSVRHEPRRRSSDGSASSISSSRR